MDCDRVRECLVAVAEECATDEEVRLVDMHVPQCIACQEEADRLAQLRERLFAAASVAPTVNLQDRVLRRIADEGGRGRAPGLEPVIGDFFMRLLYSRRARLVAAGALVIALAVAGWLALYTPPPVWAIEQSIEAMRGFRGVYVAGVIDGSRNLELWIRSGQDPSQMRDLLGRLGDVTFWVKDNRTYYYQRGGDTVYVDDAPTAGFYPWPGTELLEFARAAGFRVLSRGLDPSSGHQRIAVETTLTTSNGLESTILEFDATTKLLVGLRQWRNLDRAGGPSLDASKIVYFEDLPDHVFSDDLPAGVAHRPKDVTVPEELLGLLANPQYGLSAAGVSENEAARRIVAAMQQAAIIADWPRFRQLVPVAASWSDEMLRAICNGADGKMAVTEVVEIGEGSRRGNSRLGPLVVVPARVRCHDGYVYEEKYTIQFRGPSSARSCVVFAAYGAPYRVN
jgi:hypothetical protein